eukprot:gene20836-22879_t
MALSQKNPTDSTDANMEKIVALLTKQEDSSSINPEEVRWMSFKQLGKDKGVELLPPTHGAWKQHVLRAHLQSYIWEQDLILHPILPDPFSLGWRKEEDGLKPLLSKADYHKFATRESFNMMLEKEFNSGNSKVKVSYWACGKEMHKAGGHSHYIYTYRYVCKSDTEVAHSPGHPDLSEVGSPRAKASTAALREGSRKRRSASPNSQKCTSSKIKRCLSNLEVCDYVVENNIHNLQELVAKADSHKQE